MSKIHDVAEAAGVSIMTVSRFFNQPDALAAATRERVAEAVALHNYVPSASARSLIVGRSDILALIVSDITNPFFTTLARGVEDAAQANGYTLILGNTDEKEARERSYLGVVVSRRVDGVLISPSPGSSRHLPDLEHHRIPMVLIDRTAEGLQADVVRGDSFAGGYALARHLLEMGHERIAFIGGPSGVSSLEQRLAGYRSAMQEAGLQDLVHLGRYDRKSGEEVVASLIARDGARLPVTALVAANNAVAAGAILTLRRHGLNVPQDVSVVCFEDFEIESAADPFLTIVKQPAYEIGRKATQLLLDRIGGMDGPPREVILPIEFIARHSVKRLASGATQTDPR